MRAAVKAGVFDSDISMLGFQAEVYLTSLSLVLQPLQLLGRARVVPRKGPGEVARLATNELRFT